MKVPDEVHKWANAIRIVDASEIALRDLIERELAGVSPAKIKDTARRVNRIMIGARKLRSDAIKKAFRYLRDQS